VFAAIRKVIVYGANEVLAQLRNAFTMEANDGAHAQDASDKYVVAFVKLDPGSILLVGNQAHK